MITRKMITDKIALLIEGMINKKQISDWAVKQMIEHEDEYDPAYSDLMGNVLADLGAGGNDKMGFTVKDYRALLKKLK